MIGEEFPGVLTRAQQGDDDAFARLWRDLNGPLLRYLALGGEPAEDVAADTWASVVQGLRRFRGDEQAWRGWVFTTARRRAIDVGRQRARAQRADRAADLAPLAATVRVGPDAADVAFERLGTQEAIRLLRELPPLQAEVILLRVVAGLSVEVVARFVGRSPGAVRVASHRGLTRLGEILQRRGVTPSASRTLWE